jgi:hypothetical protein
MVVGVFVWKDNSFAELFGLNAKGKLFLGILVMLMGFVFIRRQIRTSIPLFYRPWLEILKIKRRLQDRLKD